MDMPITIRKGIRESQVLFKFVPSNKMPLLI
jgi:hypothetical protein